MITKLTNVNLEKLQDYTADILLNKNLTNASSSNMYEILFDCKNFDEVFDAFLKELRENENEDFEVYVKNMWGYVQSDSETGLIKFNRNFKDQIIIPSKYSFIYAVKMPDTTVHLNVDEELNRQVTLKEGDLLVFKTEDFIKEESTSKNRIALIGSIALIENSIEPIKKVLI